MIDPVEILLNLTNPRRGNPLDYKGNVSRCRVCQSIFHWEKDCWNTTTERLQQFTVEAFYTAILNSGASKTICGKTWLRCSEEILPKEKHELIHSEPSTSIFKFGDSRKVQSKLRVTIPAKINSTDVSIVTDLVNDDIPLLLSKEAMKKANTQIDLSPDSFFMFGTKPPLIFTNSGHYAIEYLLVKGYLLKNLMKRNKEIFYMQKQ